MSTATPKYFDTYAYVKKSKELGVKEEVAEYQVEQIEKAIETAVNFVKNDIKSKELATKKDLEVVKKDLEVKIEQGKNQVILWVAGMFIASGLLQHFFK